MRALVYTRNSSASTRSVEEQEAEARQVCDREGWDVEHVVCDMVGASRHSRRKRHGWTEAKRLIATSAVDVLVTWESSRAQRDLAAYSELRDLCAEHGVLWHYGGRLHDLADTDDRFKSAIDAMIAEREADTTAERVRRAIRANAAAGRPHGRRLFGYRRTYDPTTGALLGQEPDLDEAPVVRRIFDEYLAGAGVRTIRARLNAEGLLTASGVEWSDTTVRRVLENPAYVGQRVHRGEVMGAAGWPALVEPERFARAAARLAENRASGTRHRQTARLLTGVARCGVCGAKMMVGHDRNQRKVYVCRAGFHVARDEGKLNAYVRAAVLERLSAPDALELPDEVPVDPGRELRARLDDAIARFTAGELSASTLAQVEADLLPRIREAETAARRALAAPLDLSMPSGGLEALEAWWDALEPPVRREVVRGLIAAVVILPTVRGRRVFDPAAVSIEWRT